MNLFRRNRIQPVDEAPAQPNPMVPVGLLRRRNGIAPAPEPMPVRQPLPARFPALRREVTVADVEEITEGSNDSDEQISMIQKLFREKDMSDETRESLSSLLKDLQKAAIVEREAAAFWARFRPTGNVSEDEQTQSGEGVFLREPGKFPPESRKLIEQVGAEKVEKLTLFRYPIQISKFAKFIGALRSTPYDDLCHIGVVINGKYLTEKDAVLNFQRSGVPSQSTDTMDVLLGTRNITINDLLENTRKKMGDQRFTEYRSLSWNCQDYLQNMLEANGLSTAETTKFIKQDLEQVVKNLPSYTNAISNFFTGAKAVVNRLVKGEGQSGGKADFETPKYQKERSKKRIYTQAEVENFLDRLDDMDIREAYLTGQDFLRNAMMVDDDPTIDPRTGENGATQEQIEAVKNFMDELLYEIVVRTSNGEFAPDARFGTMDDGEEESKEESKGEDGSWYNYFFGGAARVQGFGMVEDAEYIARGITGRGGREAGSGSYVHNFQLPPSKCKF